MNYSLKALFALVAVTLAVARPLHAEAPQLSQGMGYVDVARLLGPPEEQREFEVKREVVWLYQGGERKVFFKEGKVVAWLGMTDAEPIPAASPTAVPSEPEDQVIQDLLGELTKEAQEKGGE